MTFPNTKKLIPHIIWLLYAIVLGLGLGHHELWMDEAHHWLVPRDSATLWEMLQSLRYEGHPGLWNVLLYFSTFFSEQVWIMQFLHGWIAVLSIYLLTVHSPFPQWVKWLMPFGYFMLFEYGMISRNYALAFLLAFLFVWEVKKENGSFRWLMIYLALLANTHLLGFCLSLLLCFYVKWEKPILRWPLLIYLAGLVLATLQIIPPGDHPMVTGLDWGKMTSWSTIKQLVLVFQEAFWPLHDFNRHHFWHTNWLEVQSLDFARWISLGMALLPLWFFRKQGRAVLLFYGVAGGVILLSALRGVNYERFHGFIYVAFLLLLWLEYSNLKLAQNRSLSIFVGLVLSIQLLGGVHAYYQDWKYPFSESRRTAAYLQSLEDPSIPIIGGYCFGEALQAYLPRLQYPEHPEESFCRWEIFSPEYLQELTTEDYYTRLLRYFLPLNAPKAILINHQPLDLSTPSILRQHEGSDYELQFTPLPNFTDNLKQMEAFYLYELDLIVR
ncbi:MAG: hypothetical protein HRU41_36660 [Saprospiraceae bacterium]|nr:hypothetical protein [Saprospiraceae bacterium]